jgi:hypothetical protein
MTHRKGIGEVVEACFNIQYQSSRELQHYNKFSKFPLLSCDSESAVYCVYLTVLTVDHADHINCLRPLKHCDRGFESHSRHGCMCASILYLCRSKYLAQIFKESVVIIIIMLLFDLLSFTVTLLTLIFRIQ